MTWGSWAMGQRRRPIWLRCRSKRLETSAAEITVGEYHTCARKTDGTLWCWGSNSDLQLGDGTTVDRPSPVQALIGICP
jgi:alpha-tubulin suppressor-like RCC1 family protein